MLDRLTKIERMAKGPTPYPDIAQRMRVIHILSGIRKQKDFAAALDAGESRVSNYLSGASRPPPEVMRKIKDQLHVTSDWILWGDDEGLPLLTERGLREAEAILDRYREWVNGLI